MPRHHSAWTAHFRHLPGNRHVDRQEPACARQAARRRLGLALATDVPPSEEQTWDILHVGGISDTHVAERGLGVLEVAAADDATAVALQQALTARWATATADRTTRDAGEPGVRLRC
ncbi:DUF6207 family protein [Streptomyces sp. NPDC003710]